MGKANPISGPYLPISGSNPRISNAQPGKFNKSIVVGGTYYATGSFMTSGIIRNGTAAGTIELYQGSASINLSTLTAGVVYELGVKVATVSSGTITLFQK